MKDRRGRRDSRCMTHATQVGRFTRFLQAQLPDRGSRRAAHRTIAPECRAGLEPFKKTADPKVSSRLTATHGSGAGYSARPFFTRDLYGPRRVSTLAGPGRGKRRAASRTRSFDGHAAPVRPADTETNPSPSGCSRQWRPSAFCQCQLRLCVPLRRHQAIHVTRHRAKRVCSRVASRRAPVSWR